MNRSKAGKLAPLALFTFKRPEHVRRALTSLKSNREFELSPLYIFCDGARSPDEAAEVAASREVVRALAPDSAGIVERSSNLGLDRSIMEGVSSLCEEHGRVIVMEDDLEVAPGFLGYMNRALDRYEHSDQVFQVSAYMFPVKARRADSAVFLPYPTSWGWATWKRALELFDPAAPGLRSLAAGGPLGRAFNLDDSYPYVKMLRQHLGRDVPAWDIIFYANVFLARGLVLHPSRSLVRNNGFDGSGENCGMYSLDETALPESEVRDFPELPAVDQEVFASVKAHLRNESRLSTKVRRRLLAYTGI